MNDRSTSPPTRDDYVRMLNHGLETVGRGVALLDLSGRILALNDYAARTLGIERPVDPDGDIRLEDAFPVLVDLSGRELAPSERPALGVLENGSVHPPTVLGLRRDDGDHPLWLEISASPLLDTEGRHWGVLESFVDASDRVETHLRLHELSSIAEATDNGVVVTDLERKVLWSNSAFTRMTGYTAEEARGHKPGDLLQCDETDPAAIERMRRSLDDGEGFHEELLNVMKDGSKRWIDLEVQPLYDCLGNHNRWMGVKRDITERRDIEARLRTMTNRARADAEALQLALERAERLAHEAQAATRAKDEFLRNTGHEIRTPLNGVLAAASALRDSLEDPEQAELLQIVHESGDRLLRLLDNVLQYAKIAADDLEVEPQPFPLDSLVAGLETLYLPLAAARDLEFRTEITPDPLPVVEGDPALLQRVLTLLIDNALEAAGNGSYVMLRTRARRRDRAWTVRFEVCDTGPGIDADEVERIFEPFQQLDGSMRRERQGMGLGLSIARGLVERMGGRLTLDARADRQTCFAVEIGLPATDAEREADGHGSDAFDDALACVREVRPRVLLVEDPEDPPTVLFRTLTLLGARVEIVAGGTLAGRSIDSGRFDVVIVDDAVLSALDPDALDVTDDVDLVLRTSNGRGEIPPSGFRAVLREPVDLVSLADVLAAV